MSAAAGGLTACNVGNEPVRTGESVLEFGQLGSGDPFNGGSPDAIYLQYWLGSPFDHWGYRGKSLVNDALYTPGTLTNVTTTKQPWDLTAVALVPSFKNFVKYQSVHAYWHVAGAAIDPGGPPANIRTLATQHEVLLFARDPEEHFQTLSQIRDQLLPQPYPNPPALIPLTQGFRKEFLASRLPDAASLVYPPQPNWNTRPPFVSNPGPVPVLAQYATANFWGNWGNGVVPIGPAAAPFDPEGPGSVKAVHVINHGLCSQQVPYLDTVDADGNAKSGLFPLVGPAFFPSVEKKLAESPLGSTATMWLSRSNVASFLHATTDREDAQHGGFFFNFDVNLTADLDWPIPNFSGYAELGHAYEFKLLDGRLTVEPYRDYGQVLTNIFGLPETFLQSAFDDALTQSLLVAPSPSASADSLASVVFQEADKQQEWEGIIGGADGLPCDPRAPGDETIPVALDPSAGVCGGFITWISLALRASVTGAGAIAGQRLGIPASAFNQLWETTALATMVNPHDPGNPADQVYKNFRCVPRKSKTDGTTANRCRYVMPARRLNVLPDGVELVFVDDDKEYTNPAFIPYLIALNFDKTAKLCDPPRAQTPGLLDRRSFVNYVYDGKKYTATNCHKVFNQMICDVVVQ